MRIDAMKGCVEETQARLTEERLKELERKVKDKRPPELVGQGRMTMRRKRLTEADFRPSAVDLERILGTNDLVDVNYLLRAATAARSVCRIVLRSRAGREIGYGTGFKVAPHVVMTNEHVFDHAERAALALLEFDYELDIDGRPRATTRFELDPSALFLNDRGLDFAICAIKPQPVFGSQSLASFGFLRIVEEIGKINKGEFVTLIQHPSGQPKQVALRENQLLSIEETVLWYQSDTAPGSSGAPVFNDSWQIVGLHHSGVPKRDGQGRWLLRDGSVAGPDADDGDIDWIANEGIRISRIMAFVREQARPSPVVDELLATANGVVTRPAVPLPAVSYEAPRSDTAGSETRIQPIAGGARITVPLSFDIQIAGQSLGLGASMPTLSAQTARPLVAQAPSAAVAVERLVSPLVDDDYDNRRGYDEDFLGIRVPMPQIKNPQQAAKMANGEHVIPYEHFSIIMDKERRLALLTAANVDGSSKARRPEPGRDYSRKGLNGIGKNDREKWVIDPRIDIECQLSDEFYENDRQAFDKGHLVRRDDVCWGETYAEVQRANGDSFHSTNCSPQVKDFNRSNLGGLWGDLENLILKQAKTERYCLFAGPLLRNKDQRFNGVDHAGPTRVRIPSAYFKVVVARSGDELRAYAFFLEQDLSNTPFEFSVPADWSVFMISLPRLQQRIRDLEFPEAILEADQFGKHSADELAALSGIDMIDMEQEPRTNGSGRHEQL